MKKKMSSNNVVSLNDKQLEAMHRDLPQCGELSEEDLLFLQSSLEFDEYDKPDLVLSGQGSRRWLRLAIAAGMHPDSPVLLDGPYANYNRLACAAMDGDLDQMGQLIYAFGTSIGLALGLGLGARVNDRVMTTEMIVPRQSIRKYVKSFDVLRYLCRFLAVGNYFEDRKFSFFFGEAHHQNGNKIIQETGMDRRELDRALAKVPYDGIARLALKETAIGLAACGLPVLCTIEIGDWLAAAHDDFQDNLNYHAAWTIAARTKHWLGDK